MRSCFAHLHLAALAACAFLLAPHAATAESLQTIYQFQGDSLGANPVAAISNVGGSLYGTTTFGGNGAGTVFQLLAPVAPSTEWDASVLHKFANDGTRPYGDLIAFKTSIVGATFDDTLSGNAGRIYKIKPLIAPKSGWKEVPIHAFGGAGDGWGPSAGLTKLSPSFYGTTVAGGIAGCKGYLAGADGCGTVVKLTPPATDGGVWAEEVLYRFNGGADGAVVSSGLLKWNNVFYGVTVFGGTGTCNVPGTSGGCGTIFAITPDGVKTTLHSFTGGTGGAMPLGKLIAVGGALYGTTTAGGSTGCDGLGCGTVFRLKKPTAPGLPWKMKVLHAFGVNSPLGAGPTAGLVHVPKQLPGGVPANAIYGTTVLGGSGSCGEGCGTVFKIPLTGPQTGILSTIHLFDGGAGGAHPTAGLINSDGKLIGTTEFGGTASCPGGKVVAGYQGCGTVFQITQ